MSLVITRAGRDAIGINEPDETHLPVSSKSGDAEHAHPYLAGAAPRPGSKQAHHPRIYYRGPVLFGTPQT